jgi:hypothetical protein
MSLSSWRFDASPKKRDAVALAESIVDLLAEAAESAELDDMRFEPGPDDMLLYAPEFVFEDYSLELVLPSL